jgi:hypothetical protein
MLKRFSFGLILIPAAGKDGIVSGLTKPFDGHLN